MPNYRLLENGVDRRLLEDGISLRLLEVQIVLAIPTLIGTVGTAYSSSIAASGGTSPYTSAISSGSITGSGLALNASTGALTSASLLVANNYTFVISATDSLGAVGYSNPITITVTSVAAVSSGIYKIVPGQTHDTLYSDISDPDHPTTANSAIPNPFIETALIGDENG